jgi:hypothetical protein
MNRTLVSFSNGYGTLFRGTLLDACRAKRRRDGIQAMTLRVLLFILKSVAVVATGRDEATFYPGSSASISRSP